MMLVNPQTGSIERRAAVGATPPTPLRKEARLASSTEFSTQTKRKFIEVDTEPAPLAGLESSAPSELPKVEAEPEQDLIQLELAIDDKGENQVVLNRANFIAESKNLASLTLPLWLTSLASFSAGFINTFLVGHVGKTALAAGALANMYCVMTGLSLGFGLLTASDTLCSQAFGAKNMPRVGIVFQRSLVIMIALCIPVLVFWSASSQILLALRQEAEIAELVGQYTRIAFLGFPFLMLFEAVKRYLQAQSITAPPMWISLACGFLTLPIGWLYIFWAEFGFIGAALSVATSWAMQGISLTIYTYVSKAYVATWPEKFEMREVLDFSGIKEYLALGVPGMLMGCAEWWGFELYALMSGWISQVALAAQTTMMTTASIMYMIPLSLGIATTILVGNRLGAGKWHEAVFSYKVATVITAAVALICSIFLLSLKSVWGYAFTNDEEVVEVISTNLPFLCFFLIGDSLQGSLGGALRGSGRQKWGAAINLGSYYGIGMPLAATLAFAFGWGISGLWTGFSLGSWIVVTCYLLLLSRFSNWPEIARQALESNAQSPSSTSSVDQAAP